MLNIAIKDLKIKLNIEALLKTIHSKKAFEIDINGNILQNINNKEVIVYKSENKQVETLNGSNETLIKNLFPSKYKIIIEEKICTISPIGAWIEIIEMNKNSFTYFDHQNDGIELFEDDILENYGWFASALNVNYRQIAAFIEKSQEGTFVYFDNGIIFNAFAFCKDIQTCRKDVKDFIIKSFTKNDIDLEDDDVIEALDFFEIKV